MKREGKKSDEAVSEVLGAVLMLAIAIALFAIVYIVVISYPFHSSPPRVDIVGTVQGNNIVLEHHGGESISTNSKVSIVINGTQHSVNVSKYLADSNGNKLWDMGEQLVYPAGDITGLQVEATVVDVNSNSIVMMGILQEGNISWNGGLNENYMGVSSNTSDVDGIADKGTETNFPNAQGITKDGNSMTIQEAETAGQIHKTAVQGNTCDVDSSPDKGTETNFANAQGITCDSNVMTIQEADQDSGTSTLGKTSGSGSSYTTINANTMYGQVFTATSSGEIYQATFYGRSSSGTINTKIVICDSSGNILTNGVSSAISVSATAGNKVGTWSAGSRPIVVNGQTYWIMVIAETTSVRLYYDAITGGISKGDTSNSYTTPTNPTDATSGTINYRLLYADINNLNYQIDFEYNWSKANFSDTTEYLSFYMTSHTGSETLNINYRNGASWTSLGTITTTGWKNVTATGLTSKTYTIQLIGTTETGDTSQDSWSIDCIFLHSYNASNYQIDFEYQWTAAVYNRVNKQACLYVASHIGGTENLLVNYWTGSAWSSLGTITTTGWSNFTATGLSSSTYTIQLKGATESGDSTQDRWNVDVIMLHTWTGGLK